MKQLRYYTAILMLLTFVQSSCNPDCMSLVNVQSSTTLNPVGYEILITANPISDLKGRKVFFGDVEAKSVFHEGFGLVVEVPAGVSGNLEIKIEDPDCLDVQTIPFNVIDDDYFFKNIDFVPPTPPDIIIPEIPIAFPSYVDNAWLSADNPGYCLWFKMHKVNGEETSLVNPDSSFEQSTCWCEQDFNVSHLPYAMNRMGGVIDKESNFIHIFIDRTPIGGTIEEFSGMFIDLAATSYLNNLGTLNCPDPCFVSGAHPPTTGHMLLLTSKQTGRQVVAYQKVP